MKDAQIHTNRHAMKFVVEHGYWPPGDRATFGHQLEDGEVLEATDVYESTNGGWELCPCPGLALQTNALGISDLKIPIWVRPI